MCFVLMLHVHCFAWTVGRSVAAGCDLVHLNCIKLKLKKKKKLLATRPHLRVCVTKVKGDTKPC